MSDEQMDSYFRNLDELFNLRQKNESLKKENSLLKRRLEEAEKALKEKLNVNN